MESADTMLYLKFELDRILNSKRDLDDYKLRSKVKIETLCCIRYLFTIFFDQERFERAVAPIIQTNCSQ